MGELVQFDVEIVRHVQSGELRWPTGERAESDSGLGGNREYYDLRGLGWQDVQDTLREERQMIERLLAAEDLLEEYEVIEEERYEDDGAMLGLDVGVASATAALSAAGCIPFASCNGGALGDIHHEAYPLIAFCARSEYVPLLLAIAEQVDLGLERGGYGDLIVYARDVRQMIGFAEIMLANRERFSHLIERGDDGRGAEQPTLFD